MIEINLLPAQYRVKKREKGGKRKKVAPEKKTLFLLSIVIGVFLILGVVGYSFLQQIELKKVKKELAKTEEEMKSLEPLYEKVTLAKKGIATIKPKLAALDSLVKSRKLWSRKLNQISWLLHEKIWLTNIEVKREEKIVKRKVGEKEISEKVSKTLLTLKGSAVSLEGEERLKAIADFMAILKGSKGFFADYFEDLRFINCSSREIGNFDVMDFTFELSLKSNETQTYGTK